MRSIFIATLFDLLTVDGFYHTADDGNTADDLYLHYYGGGEEDMDSIQTNSATVLDEDRSRQYSFVTRHQKEILDGGLLTGLPRRGLPLEYFKNPEAAIQAGPQYRDKHCPPDEHELDCIKNPTKNESGQQLSIQYFYTCEKCGYKEEKEFYVPGRGPVQSNGT